MADPPAALAARLAGIDAAVTTALGTDLDPAAATDAAALVRRAVDASDAAGRPLFAANRELAWPDAPHLALWLATTLLREHRGDGHVIALSTTGIDGCEAHVTQVIA